MRAPDAVGARDANEGRAEQMAGVGELGLQIRGATSTRLVEVDGLEMRQRLRARRPR